MPSGCTSATADRSSVETRTDVTGAPVKVSKTATTSPTRVGRSNLASIHWPSGGRTGLCPTRCRWSGRTPTTGAARDAPDRGCRHSPQELEATISAAPSYAATVGDRRHGVVEWSWAWPCDPVGLVAVITPDRASWTRPKLRSTRRRLSVDHVGALVVRSEHGGPAPVQQPRWTRPGTTSGPPSTTRRSSQSWTSTRGSMSWRSA